MATRRKKTPARRSSRSGSKQPSPVQTAVVHQGGLKVWPLILIALCIGVVLYLFQKQTPPQATVTNNIPPARESQAQIPPHSGPKLRVPKATAIPSGTSAASAPAAVSTQASVAEASLTTVWDRSNPKQPKITFKLVQAEGSPAEVSIFKKPNTLVRRLISESGTAGKVSLSWDGLDSNGQKIAAGKYLMRFSDSSGESIDEILIK